MADVEHCGTRKNGRFACATVNKFAALVTLGCHIKISHIIGCIYCQYALQLLEQHFLAILCRCSSVQKTTHSLVSIEGS